MSIGSGQITDIAEGMDDAKPLGKSIKFLILSYCYSATVQQAVYCLSSLGQLTDVVMLDNKIRPIEQLHFSNYQPYLG